MTPEEEKEFDEKWSKKTVSEGGFMAFYDEEFEDIEYGDESAKSIKQFISQLLQQRDKELVEKIKGMKENAKQYPMIGNDGKELVDWNRGYKAGLNGILSLLQNK